MWQTLNGSHLPQLIMNRVSYALSSERTLVRRMSVLLDADSYGLEKQISLWQNMPIMRQHALRTARLPTFIPEFVVGDWFRHR